MFQGIDDSDNDNDSDSDIQQGPPLKRRKPIPSVSRTCTPLGQINQFTNSRYHGAVNAQSSSARSQSDTDSEPDDFGARHRSLPKPKHRRLQQQTRDSTPAHGEVRFSTRKAARVSNYNVDDTTPHIDQVLDHKLLDEEILEPTITDFKYNIKWRNKAHYHATWEEWPDVESIGGKKKVQNYFVKIALEDFYMSHDRTVPPEEREKWNLDREQKLDEKDAHSKVDRVIGKRLAADGQIEYFVKC